jgi:hypothetical protein
LICDGFTRTPLGSSDGANALHANKRTIDELCILASKDRQEGRQPPGILASPNKKAGACAPAFLIHPFDKA